MPKTESILYPTDEQGKQEEELRELKAHGDVVGYKVSVDVP